jgi:hypothetical protein
VATVVEAALAIDCNVSGVFPKGAKSGRLAAAAFVKASMLMPLANAWSPSVSSFIFLEFLS